MTELLWRSWIEMATRRVALIQCFWPVLALYGVVLFFVLNGVITEREAIVGSIPVVVLTLAPGAVRWHRHVIAAEAVTWVPTMPDVRAVEYSAKLVGLTIAFAAIQEMVSNTAQDIMVPVIGLVFRFNDPYLAQFIAAVASIALTLMVYLSLLGTWMLQLPEGALDAQGLSARRDWRPSGKKSFLSALFTIYFVASIVKLELLFVELPVESDVNTMLFYATAVCLNLLAATFALSLLTITYKGQLDRAGMSFGRKCDPNL